MKQNHKGITMVSLVVTIIVLIILAGVSINLTLGNDGIITKAKQAKENMELAQVEEATRLNELYAEMNFEESESSNYDAIVKLEEFKSAIATAITNQGVETSSDATAETMAENIGKILSSSTPGTATENDIAGGKTAWVNGTKITGSMSTKSTSDTILSFASDIQIINLQTEDQDKTFQVVSGAEYLLVTEARYGRIVEVYSGAIVNQDISSSISKIEANSKAFIITTTSSNLVLRVTTSNYCAGVGVLIRLS